MSEGCIYLLVLLIMHFCVYCGIQPSNDLKFCLICGKQTFPIAVEKPKAGLSSD